MFRSFLKPRHILATAAVLAAGTLLAGPVCRASTGGHLALWASVWDQLPAGSPLLSHAPFVPRSVISLAGIGDLKAFARMVPILCGPGIIDRLAPQTTSADPYAEISPTALPPPTGRVVMISGIVDRLAPLRRA
jgi:hypothetical protein